MQYDDIRGAEKQEEIVSIVRQALFEQVKIDDEKNAAALVRHFATVEPPEAPSASFELVRIYEGGDGGGRSTKPGNVRLNLRKLVVAVAEGTVTLAGVTAAPWTALLAALVVWDKLWAATQTDLSEVEAAVLWALWRKRDGQDTVAKRDVAELVNAELTNVHRSAVTQAQVDSALAKLTRIGCIQTARSTPDRYWLREWVQISYR